MCTYLQRRGNRYYIRRAVPAELRVAYGRREVTRALGTSNYAEAKARCRAAAVALDDEFQTVAKSLLDVQQGALAGLPQETAYTAPRAPHPSTRNRIRCLRPGKLPSTRISSLSCCIPCWATQ